MREKESPRLKQVQKSFRDWDDNPGVSSIERVKLRELEFPSVTVCPAFPTDSIATKTIYNGYKY